MVFRAFHGLAHRRGDRLVAAHLAEDPDQIFPTEAELPTVEDAARLLERAYRTFDSLQPKFTPDWLNTPRTFPLSLVLPPWLVLRHVVNHTTYHRGQVASKLKRFGIQQVETDLPFWAMEQVPQLKLAFSFALAKHRRETPQPDRRRPSLGVRHQGAIQKDRFATEGAEVRRMTYEIRVCYTEAVVRRAAQRFLARFTRRDVAIGLGAALAGAGAWLGLGLDWPYAAALVGVGLALVALVVLVGLAYVRAAIGKFRAMADSTVLWRFGDDSLATASDLGSVEIRWQAVSEVWRFPEVWLLFFGARGWGYSTLPTDALETEVQDFILARIRANGGKVS